METISFTKAIMMVHPDKNPNMVDAGTKVRQIMMYKNKPSMMCKLLKSWGILDSKKTTKIIYNVLTTLFNNHDYSGDRVYILHRRYYGRFMVAKTTSKRVYFSEQTVKERGLKYCSVNSVVKAFREELK